MENKPKTDGTVDSPNPSTYEERLRMYREATRAKLEKPATPAPAAQEEAQDAFYEEYEDDDFSLSELFEEWKSKFKSIFKKPDFSKWKNRFKKPSLSLPKIFKKKSDKDKTDTIAKEETNPVNGMKFGKFKTGYTWFDKKLNALSKSLLFGIVVAIILNVITNRFWPELPTKIPTVYGFFNGFLTLAEFVYKTALGGIAAIFNGTLSEFSLGVSNEIKEMWNAFCTWMSSIKF